MLRVWKSSSYAHHIQWLKSKRLIKSESSLVEKELFHGMSNRLEDTVVDNNDMRNNQYKLQEGPLDSESESLCNNKLEENKLEEDLSKLSKSPRYMENLASFKIMSSPRNVRKETEYQRELRKQFSSYLYSCKISGDYVYAKKLFGEFMNMGLKPDTNLCSLLIATYTKAAIQNSLINPEKAGRTYRSSLAKKLLTSSIELYSLMHRENIPITESFVIHLFELTTLGGDLNILKWILPNNFLHSNSEKSLSNSELGNDKEDAHLESFSMDGYVVDEIPKAKEIHREHTFSISPYSEFNSMNFSERLQFSDLPPEYQILPSPTSKVQITARMYLLAIIFCRSLPFNAMHAYYCEAIRKFPKNLSLLKTFFYSLNEKFYLNAHVHIRHLNLASIIHYLRLAIGLTKTTISWDQHQSCIENIWKSGGSQSASRPPQTFIKSTQASTTMLKMNNDKVAMCLNTGQPIAVDISISYLPITKHFGSTPTLEWHTVPDITLHRIVIVSFRKLSAFQYSVDYFRLFCLSDSNCRYDSSLNAMIINSLIMRGQLNNALRTFEFLEKNISEVVQTEIKNLEYIMISKASVKNKMDTSLSKDTRIIPQTSDLKVHPMIPPLSAIIFGLARAGRVESALSLFSKYVMSKSFNTDTSSVFQERMKKFDALSNGTTIEENHPLQRLETEDTGNTLKLAFENFELNIFDVSMFFDILFYAVLPGVEYPTDIYRIRLLLEWFFNVCSPDRYNILTHASLPEIIISKLQSLSEVSLSFKMDPYASRFADDREWVLNKMEKMRKLPALKNFEPFDWSNVKNHITPSFVHNSLLSSRTKSRQSLRVKIVVYDKS